MDLSNAAQALSRKAIKVPPLETPQRLDLFLSSHFNLTRSKIQKMIEIGDVRVEGKNSIKPGMNLKGGEVIHLSIRPSEPSALSAEDIPLEILYEDESILAINKPPGLVVHPAAGHWSGTLVNALLHHFKKLSGVDPARPGIVHRLDKETSGILLIAKTDEAHLALSNQLKDRKMEKIYLAVVHGKVKNEKGTIRKPIGRNPSDRKKMAVVRTGKEAITHYRVLKRADNRTLLECKIETGRTHQIRVHLAGIGHPVVGDTVYGKKKGDAPRQLLHAWKATFTHPTSGQRLSLEAPVPPEMGTHIIF